MHAEGAKRVPRARGLPLVGSLFPAAHDPAAFFERIVAAHGDVVSFDVLGSRICFFQHPAARAWRTLGATARRATSIRT